MIVPEVLAQVSLMPTEHGGRLTSICSGEYRAVLGVEAGHFSARWVVPVEELVPGGRSGLFGIQFLVPEAALPHFTKGTEFSVWEGSVIGQGRIIEAPVVESYGSP